MRWRIILTSFLLILLGVQVWTLFPPYEWWNSLRFSQRESQELQQLSHIAPDDWSGQSVFWQEMFQNYKKEPNVVYTKYIRFYRNYNQEQQHTAAHMMGGVIYDLYGKEGLAICDSTYAFGCFHELFSRAVGEHGITVVKDLDAACIARWGEKGLGCQHGIGHALLAALGEEKIYESLDVCRTLNWQGPIGGCTSGVFMEYNFATVRSQKGFQLRKYDEDSPFTPCDRVKKEFQEACYFEQPAWWWQIFQKDVKKVGSLCRLVEGEILQQSCFWGLGHILANGSDFEVDKAMELCDQLDVAEARDWCKEGNAWGFFASAEHRGKASAVCQHLSVGTKKDRCLEQVSLDPHNPWIIGQGQ